MTILGELDEKAVVGLEASGRRSQAVGSLDEKDAHLLLSCVISIGDDGGSIGQLDFRGRLAERKVLQLGRELQFVVVNAIGKITVISGRGERCPHGLGDLGDLSIEGRMVHGEMIGSWTGRMRRGATERGSGVSRVVERLDWGGRVLT